MCLFLKSSAYLILSFFSETREELFLGMNFNSKTSDNMVHNLTASENHHGGSVYSIYLQKYLLIIAICSYEARCHQTACRTNVPLAAPRLVLHPAPIHFNKRIPYITLPLAVLTVGDHNSFMAMLLI